MSGESTNKENGLCNDFQEQVSKVLIRHKSILDIMTKLEEYNSRINRAVAKYVTSCGCISINATKQDYSRESFQDNLETVKNHLEGEICLNCKDILEKEIGSYMFYLAAICNTLGLNIEEIIANEHETIKTLGIFSLK